MSEEAHSGLELPLIAVSCLLLIITAVLACITYSQYGWRVYSKLAYDLRVKDATSRRDVFFLTNRFTTCLKLDCQVPAFSLEDVNSHNTCSK